MYKTKLAGSFYSYLHKFVLRGSKWHVCEKDQSVYTAVFVVNFLHLPFARKLITATILVNVVCRKTATFLSLSLKEKSCEKNRRNEEKTRNLSDEIWLHIVTVPLDFKCVTVSDFLAHTKSNSDNISVKTISFSS